LLDGRVPWTAKKGKVLRGYISRVDGSTQTYGVIVPSSYDGTTPIRLDVVLHGSMRPVGLSELRFGARFDEGDDTTEAAPNEKFIELHPLGRVENCYRWAGETDVFEAIESVCRNYKIDRDRIVLRGMSMRVGTGARPRIPVTVALGPHSAVTWTRTVFRDASSGSSRSAVATSSRTRAAHARLWTTPSTGVVPAIAAISDKDVFFQAHVIMVEAMAKKG
jgi:hypothetical protein